MSVIRKSECDRVSERKAEKENPFNFTCSVAGLFLHFVSRFQSSVAKKKCVSQVKNHNKAEFFVAFVRNS